MKVLVIDDSNTIRRSAEIFLKQGGYDVLLAEDGFDALSRINDTHPDIIFCDEPTGALDEMNSKRVLRALQDLHHEYGKTIVVITHNNGIAQMAHTVIRMNSGAVVEVVHNDVQVDAEDVEWA